MKWALIDSSDIVRNIIVISPDIPYTPADYFSLEEVNDWVNIGDPKDTPEPV